MRHVDDLLAELYTPYLALTRGELRNEDYER